ncbi:hypothetical protein PtB15_7B744 [Puccinia triticina]|nr:hypothetical protein PtB15_7B744 [Puccinia triticina]
MAWLQPNTHNFRTQTQPIRIPAHIVNIDAPFLQPFQQHQESHHHSGGGPPGLAAATAAIP